MKTRAKIVLIVFAIVGLTAIAINPKSYAARSEEWMEEVVPVEVPGYTVTGSSSTDEGMRMDQMVYDILQPFGIVSRRYTGDDGRSYELVIIAGNTRKSFHDPQVCFSAQNWYFQSTQVRNLDIPALGGEAPATVIALRQPGILATSIYFYKTPMGVRPSPAYVPFDLTAAKLLWRDYVDAQFFRFIVSPATAPANESREAHETALQQDVEAIEHFAQAALGELAKTEEGRYFLVQN